MDGDSRRPQANVIAALTYLLGFVTGLIFLYLEPYNQDEFIRFHARQSIGFSVAWFAIGVVFGVFIAVLPHGLGSLLNFILTLSTSRSRCSGLCSCTKPTMASAIGFPSWPTSSTASQEPPPHSSPESVSPSTRGKGLGVGF